MHDESKTKDQLLRELKTLRSRVTELEVRGATVDISEHERTVEALRQSEQKYRTILRNMEEGYIELNRDGEWTFCNESAARMFGYDGEEWIGKSYKEYRNDLSAQRIYKVYTEVLKTGRTQQATLDVVAKDGSKPVLEASISLRRDARGKAIGYSTVVRDVTTRKQAEKALIESEEKFRKMIELSPNPLMITDRNHDIDYFNKKFTETFGYTTQDVSLTKDWWKTAYPDPEYREKVRKSWEKAVREAVVDDKETAPQEWNIVCKDGTVKSVEFRMVPISGISLIVLSDLTERKKTQELMIQNEKMISVGGLAAGMAHEINNPLGGIMQSTQNILRRISPDFEKNIEAAEECGIEMTNLYAYFEKRDILSFLQGIRESGQRAAKIISNMLQFSRKSDSKMTPVDPRSIMERTLELAGSDYDLKKNLDFRNIEIVREYDPDTQPVRCTETEIEQVVLNILRNAAQAMADREANKTARIVLRTMNDQDSVRMEIEDNGPGMDEATRKRIFEPFFSTKPVGSGTGLGLSVSYMIVTNNHKGTLEVESELGQGTRFVLRLPLKR
ncbi:MAG: PAS domain S-box protein [Proteobacteria bacterium]|nr:PAS domain S-box protein [Pseudomonadota bacterium]